VLSVRGAIVRFGGLIAVDALDLELPARGVFLLVGPNGAGKTTLINALTRVSPMAEGTATLDGVDLLRLRPHDVIKHGIARSFQRAELFGSLSVIENVMVGLNTSGSAHLDRERASALLQRLTSRTCGTRRR
jgi:branched-chain amino acid transport system ATP-binding protein